MLAILSVAAPLAALHHTGLRMSLRDFNYFCCRRAEDLPRMGDDGGFLLYGLIGKITAVHGQRDALAAVLQEGTRSMPGCLAYTVAFDAADPDALWISEIWDSEASHQASLTRPAVQAAIAKGRPLIAGFSNRVETVPLGAAVPAQAVYERMLEAWNRRNADDFAAVFADDGSVVGFDGSTMNGREEIAAALRGIFKDHPTAAYVSKIRDVRSLGHGVILLRAVVGMVPPGGDAINPAVNAVQSVVVAHADGGSRIALLHNTPAAFHGRPEMAEQLTRELTDVLRSGRLVARDPTRDAQGSGEV